MKFPCLNFENCLEKQMTDERYKTGLALSEKVLDSKAQAVVMQQVREVAPDFANYMIEFFFGDIYARPGLDLKTREIVAVAALSAIGHAQPQLKGHIKGALKVGCTREEVTEILMQTVLYAGFPAALNGLFAAREVFAEIDGK
jgi:4-carboxymuconolactone decarboxylase